MIDLGWVRPSSTIYIPFNTFDSNDPSASVTISAFAVGDIKIFKNGNATERASTAGYALLDTDGIDFSAETGIHGFSINLADNTDAGFYMSGQSYWVIVGPITVDAATVNFVSATFRIGYTGALLNTNAATINSQTSIAMDAGPGEDDALNGCTVVFHDLTTTEQIGHATITDYAGSTKTLTLAAGATFTVAVDDHISIFPPAYVSHWNGIALQTTNPLPNAASGTNGGLPTVDANNTVAVRPGYTGGFIWVDTIGGAAGTTSYVNGTAENPVNSIASAKTIADNLNLTRFYIMEDSSITLAATYDNYEFFGKAWTLNLGTQSVDQCVISGATLAASTYSGTPSFVDCRVGAITGPPAYFQNCGLEATITCNAAGDWFFNQCYSTIAGSGTPGFDFGAAVANTNFNLRHYSGGIELKNCGQSGTDVASIEGMGQVVFNANCSGGSCTIRGNFTITDNAGGAVTVTDGARFAEDQTIGANVLQLNSDATAAANLANSASGIITGTCSGTPTTTSTDSDLTGYVTGELVSRIITFNSGTANGQQAVITSYTSTNGVIGFDALTTAPAASDTFTIN